MKKAGLFLFFSVLWAGEACFSDQSVGVVAFEYPPIYQNDSDKGLSCEIVLEAFAAVHLSVDLSFLPVIRMVSEVSQGRAICGIGGQILFQAPEVSSTVNLSKPIQYVVQTFAYDSRVYPEGIKYHTLDDLVQYRIGVLNGSGIMKFLEQTKGLQLTPNVIHAGSATQLYEGRIDLWAIVDLTASKYLKQLYPDKWSAFQFTKPYHLGDVSVAFSKLRDPDHRYFDLFQEGLKIIKHNGKYMKIVAKYYGGAEAINRESLADDMR